MHDSPFRLRAKPAGDDYPSDQCAAVRCTARPVVDDDSRTIWDCRVPLCDKHLELRSPEEEDSCPVV